MIENTIKELNTQLEGVIMGENAMSNLKDKAQDYRLIELIDNTLCTVQRNKDAIVKEIEELGGKPTHNEGVWGKILDIFNNIKDMAIDTDREVLEKAIEGTEMGFKAILDFLMEEENLHDHFKKELINVSDEYTKNIKEMQEYLIKLA